MKLKSWDSIIGDSDFEPEYIELVLQTGNGGEVVNCLLLDGIRVDYGSIPQGWVPYAIRHSDEDMGVPAALERSVVVNFFGTVLADHEIDLGEKGWIGIEDYVFKDWRDVADEELAALSEERGLDASGYVDVWDNLAPIRENIEAIRLAMAGDCENAVR